MQDGEEVEVVDVEDDILEDIINMQDESPTPAGKRKSKSKGTSSKKNPRNLDRCVCRLYIHAPSLLDLLQHSASGITRSPQPLLSCI